MGHDFDFRGLGGDAFAVTALAAVAAGLIAGSAQGQVTGDFNGDGFADLAVGVPSESLGSGAEVILSAGVVHIIFGTSGGLKSQNDQYWHMDKPHIPTRAEAGDRFGAALAVGDFDGDGFDDLAIGIPGKEIDDEFGAGAVFILRGKSGGLSTQRSSFWSQNSQGIIDGARENENFGSALTTGDFNNDGFDDLAIGVPREGGPGVEGAVNVLYGSADGLTRVGNQFFKKGSGRELAAGDFNRDGFDDLIIGSPNETVSGEENAGALRLLFGSAEGLSASGLQKWSQDSSGIGEFAEANDQFAASLAVGDFDNDGYDDLAVGIAREDQFSTIDHGRVQIFYGRVDGLSAIGTQAWTQDSPGVKGRMESGDFFGFALIAGDFNGDGFDDLAIGVPGQTISGAALAGAVNVLYGSADNLTASGDQLWHQNVSGIKSSSQEQDRFGIALAAGDFDNDGAADLAVGVPGERVSRQDSAGAIAVIYGLLNSGLTADGDDFWHQNRPGIADECEPGDNFGNGN